MFEKHNLFECLLSQFH